MEIREILRRVGVRLIDNASVLIVGFDLLYPLQHFAGQAVARFQHPRANFFANDFDLFIRPLSFNFFSLVVC